MRKAGVIALAIVVLGQAAAIGQPVSSNAAIGQPNLVSGLPVESVTVVATKPSDAAIKTFVETRAVPTRVLNKIARWSVKVCPHTFGLGDNYAKYINQRILDIARAVGAPVNVDPSCRANIEVAFTSAPQGLMDDVRKTIPVFLGYYDSLHQAEELAKVTHPIQAWYATTSQDWFGNKSIDRGRCSGGVSLAGVFFPCAIGTRSIGGTRLNNSVNSGFFNVLIVAEPAQLTDYEMGSLADYIAMMALSQAASLDSCQELPSISNLLAKSCASVTGRITDGDLAYLHALYKLAPGQGMSYQRDEMRFEMKKTLVTDKGN
jgi:hypothetical protein